MEFYSTHHFTVLVILQYSSFEPLHDKSKDFGLCTQQTLLSDLTGSRADLSLHWVQSQYRLADFVIQWLIKLLFVYLQEEPPPLPISSPPPITSQDVYVKVNVCSKIII